MLRHVLMANIEGMVYKNNAGNFHINVLFLQENKI